MCFFIIIVSKLFKNVILNKTSFLSIQNMQKKIVTYITTTGKREDWYNYYNCLKTAVL